jgi:ferritin-like protein
MRQSTRQGSNRTGTMAAPEWAEQMVAATREFPPSSPGDALAIAEVRIAYAQEGEGIGEAPTLLMDKLGERLAFEHAGARLYEALLSKHRAYGSFEGGPTGEDLLHVLTEEYEHADLLTGAIKNLGGDPTALTPAANLAINISAGLPQVLSDPRTTLLQSLQAIVVAELADNECWTALAQLASQAGQDELAEQCGVAIEHERDHLRKVRTWIAAGQGRMAVDGDGAEMPGAEEYTFSEDSPVDREGYAVSDEERAESGETPERPPTGTSGRRPSARRGRK